jgi:hypothetical protein
VYEIENSPANVRSAKNAEIGIVRRETTISEDENMLCPLSQKIAKKRNLPLNS